MKKIIQIIAFLVLVAASTATGQGVRGGHLENIVFGENITAPAWAYIDTTDGKVYKATATDLDKGAQILIMVSGVTDADGQAYWAGIVGGYSETLAPGKVIYLSDTAGEATEVPPSNVQRLGYITADGFLLMDIGRLASSGGASDALGTGFTSGGGTGAIPSGTSAEAGGFSYPVYLSFNNSSHQTRDAFNLSGLWATNSSDDVGYFGYYDEEGLPFPLIEAHDVSGNYSRLFLRPTASDFSTAGDLSFSAVGNQVFSGQLITLSASNGVQMPTLDSATKEGLTPLNGVEVWDTDLDGKCVYDGTKWFRLSQESTPTIAVGAGAGTGATVSVVGNDIEGVITLTGGTGATASATVFTLTFFDSYTTAPHGVIITPADADAANFPAGRIPAFDTVSTTTFTMINASVNGITNAVVYKYAYRVIQ